MKKLISLAILALLGFYVAWPAWSSYRIYSALENQDAGALDGKIDFVSVRASLRPAVATEVEKQFDAQTKQLGGGLPIGDVKKQILPKFIDATLDTIVTPANILRIYREGGDVAGTVTKIMGEQLGKSGGIPGLGGLPGLGGSGSSGGSAPGGLGSVLGGLGNTTGQFGVPGLGGTKPADPQPQATPKSSGVAQSSVKPSYGLSNIKRFGFSGPLGLELGVAKDAGKAGPDVTAGMTFTGMDWKLTRLVPSL